MDTTWREIASIGLRWLHLIGGILWVGLGFYMNFVHAVYLPQLDPSIRKTAFLGIVPRVLYFMVLGALVSVSSGLILGWVAPRHPLPSFDWLNVGIILALLMFGIGAFIIVPCTLMALKAFRAGIPMPAWAMKTLPLCSKLNAFLSVPMIFAMLAGAGHFSGPLVPWIFGVFGVGWVLVWFLFLSSRKVTTEV